MSQTHRPPASEQAACKPRSRSPWVIHPLLQAFPGEPVRNQAGSMAAHRQCCIWRMAESANYSHQFWDKTH